VVTAAERTPSRLMCCTHCSLRLTGATALWNDEPDRDPFCSADCMEAEQTFRELERCSTRS
jgi:hypothetical protein